MALIRKMPRGANVVLAGTGVAAALIAAAFVLDPGALDFGSAPSVRIDPPVVAREVTDGGTALLSGTD